MRFSIYRFNPESDKSSYMQDYELDIEQTKSLMVLDALKELKVQDPTLSFRRSCGEGVCGSDGLNINGKNMLACITPLSSLSEPVVIKPLPGMRIVRDLIVDMSNFYNQFRKIKPFLQNSNPPPDRERLQTIQQRRKLDGLYECILCACCSSACPSFWWNPDKFLGPAALLYASRFIVDSRDSQTRSRLQALNDAYSVFRCRSIFNCADVCPKELNPAKAINNIKVQMLKEDV